MDGAGGGAVGEAMVTVFAGIQGVIVATTLLPEPHSSRFLPLVPPFSRICSTAGNGLAKL